MTVRRFTVESTKTGKLHSAIERKSRISTASLDGPGSIDGLSEYRLDDNRPLSPVSPGEYKDQWSEERFLVR